jgi:hypothetical protein
MSEWILEWLRSVLLHSAHNSVILSGAFRALARGGVEGPRRRSLAHTFNTFSPQAPQVRHLWPNGSSTRVACGTFGVLRLRLAKARPFAQDDRLVLGTGRGKSFLPHNYAILSTKVRDKLSDQYIYSRVIFRRSPSFFSSRSRSAVTVHAVPDRDSYFASNGIFKLALTRAVV